MCIEMGGIGWLNALMDGNDNHYQINVREMHHFGANNQLLYYNTRLRTLVQHIAPTWKVLIVHNDAASRIA